MALDLKKIFIPLIAALLSVSILWIARSVAFRFLHHWAERTEAKTDDLILQCLRTPSLYWILAVGLYLGIAVSELPGKYIFYLSQAIRVLIILSITAAAANLAGNIFRIYTRKINLILPATGLAYGLLKGTILITGLLILLSALGVSITPLITALGIGGLAVALALQDTLANLFAGIHLLVEKSIRVGDFIKLESGQEGYVEDITWRTTRVRMLPNNIVVVPNNKLSQSIVTNYYLPEKRMSLLIPVSVGYDSDPETVERVLIEEAQKAVREVPGMIQEEKPFVRFIPGFGESSLDFTLICQVHEFVDQYLAQHELRKRIFKRLKEEAIEIPFPQRTVRLRREGSREEGAADP